MLTEKEREWLTVRKKACARCGKVPSRCSQDQRNVCYRAGFPLWDKTTVTFESYRDAAEFEARAKVILARYNADDSCVPGGLMYCDSPDLTCFDCRIANANILAEQEMDNERNHA